jgi:sorting nexin-3/12
MSEQDNNNNKTDDQKKKKVDRKKLSSEYQVPEYIDVEVVEPITHQENGKDSYTTYKINVITTLPQFKKKEFSVRRRYKDFAWLRNHLKDKLDEKGKRLTIAELPGNTFGSLFGWSRYDAQFVEERRKGLEAFLNSVVNHPWARFEEGLHKFLEDQDFDCVDK